MSPILQSQGPYCHRRRLPNAAMLGGIKHGLTLQKAAGSKPSFLQRQLDSFLYSSEAGPSDRPKFLFGLLVTKQKAEWRKLILASAASLSRKQTLHKSLHLPTAQLLSSPRPLLFRTGTSSPAAGSLMIMQSFRIQLSNKGTEGTYIS